MLEPEALSADPKKELSNWLNIPANYRDAVKYCSIISRHTRACDFDLDGTALLGLVYEYAATRQSLRVFVNSETGTPIRSKLLRYIWITAGSLAKNYTRDAMADLRRPRGIDASQFTMTVANYTDTVELLDAVNAAYPNPRSLGRRLLAAKFDKATDQEISQEIGIKQCKIAPLMLAVKSRMSEVAPQSTWGRDQVRLTSFDTEIEGGA